MTQNGYNYNLLVHDALCGVVREVIADAEKNGLPGRHHFYITFATGHEGVEMPDYLRVQYPDEMPLVLENQFWGLEALDDAFEVTLSFKGVHERLHIPYDAITAFADPSVNFVLRLGMTQTEDDEATPELEAEPDPQEPPEDGDDLADADMEDGHNVVSIDSFRKS